MRLMDSSKILHVVSNGTMGGACSKYGSEERRIQDLVGKPEGKRPRRRCEDNIKMDLQEVGCGVWTESSWVRIGTGGGHL
jgi:hypothetical protein